MSGSSRQLRILHIAEAYPPSYGGGAAVTTQEECRSLAALGHDVRVLSLEAQSEKEPYSVRTELDGVVQIDRVNLPFAAVDPDGWLAGIKEWRAHSSRIQQLTARLFERWKPNIVDYHTARPFGEGIFEGISRARIPVIATLHDGWLVCLRLMFLRSPTSTACEGPDTIRCLECNYSHYDGSHAKMVAKLPWRIIKLGRYPAWRLRQREKARGLLSGAIARSEFMAEMHRPHMNCPIEHIPLGIDLRGLGNGKLETRRNSSLRFGFVGGFQPNKGIWHILDAAATLRDEGYPFELHIWGPLTEQGEEEIGSRNLSDRVKLRGLFSPAQRWDAYREMDIAVMATLVSEPFGRVPMEAGAVGVPTIAPAVGGIKETIRDGIDGLHFRFRDKEDLTRQMRRVLKENGMLESLSSNLPKALSSSDQILHVERFYNRIIDASG